MKKIIVILLLAISFSAKAQTSKADSIKIAEQNKAVEKIITTTTIKDFQAWLFDKITASQYNTFLQYYNAFIVEKYNASLQDKKVK